MLKILGYNLFVHKVVVVTIFLLFVFFLYGFPFYCLMNRFQNRLNRLGLTNGISSKPTIESISEEEFNRKKVVIYNGGIGIKQFQNKQDDLEATFGQKVESISSNDLSPEYTIVMLTKNNWPKVVKFSSLNNMDLPRDHFIIGHTLKGVITQNINELPHMLIAGTTGSGKSIMFKQMIVSLMKSSPYLQVFLLDLKSGIEMQDFQHFPNVTVVKDIRKAVLLLNKIKEEMDRRFSYLEQNGYREIIPERDKMDKILVGIDESSVLYMKNHTNPELNTVSQNANELTDSLAKLSRAAGIHLLLATQKVTKETIDTHIQENISGKFCFKTNTLQGSLTVLGNGMACSLPDVPGRGIWNLGNKFLEVQVPLITQTDIKEFEHKLKLEYENGERRMLQKKIDINSSSSKPQLLTENNL
ncbi:MAG: DUF87 domain-containing protein [Oligoflexia bacterium]|nr:DUF87 domain-containing protein [Oligoflexia bacterium]